MYQSIYYDYSTYTYHLQDDKQGWLEFQFQPTYWKRVNEYQEGARPVLTGGYAIPTKKLDKNDPDLLEKDIDKNLLVLRELYYKEDDVVPSWHNIVYIIHSYRFSYYFRTKFIDNKIKFLLKVVIRR